MPVSTAPKLRPGEQVYSVAAVDDLPAYSYTDHALIIESDLWCTVAITDVFGLAERLGCHRINRFNRASHDSPYDTREGCLIYERSARGWTARWAPIGMSKNGLDSARREFFARITKPPKG